MRAPGEGGRLVAGRYALQGIIGRGGMSSVWVGRDTVLERDVALKPLGLLPGPRAAALCQTVTIDLDTTDVEVYGRRKRGVAFNHQGQRVGRPHVATWAETATGWPRT